MEITRYKMYTPGEHEAEKASNSYLMSLIVVVAGLPLPIINLIATLVFWLANRRATYFVRWHCMQALLSQFLLFFMNSYGFWWTISLIFGERSISNEYIAYLITLLVVNLTEFIVTIYTAIQTRKGKHISWWFYGSITDIIVKP
ncbi:MAG: DUF4870 domain-containing protein [Bacteroidetes bacterium]|nr:DUF4870 domain-containing protein [Bacteroidota bacterium]